MADYKTYNWSKMSDREISDVLSKMSEQERAEALQEILKSDAFGFRKGGLPHYDISRYSGPTIGPYISPQQRRKEAEELQLRQQAMIEAKNEEAKAREAEKERQRKRIALETRTRESGVALYDKGNPKGIFKFFPATTKVLEKLKATDVEAYTFQHNLIKCIEQYKVGGAFRTRSENSFKLSWGQEKQVPYRDPDEIQVFAELKGRLIRAIYNEIWLQLSIKEDYVYTGQHYTKHTSEERFYECDQGVGDQFLAVLFTIGIEVLKKYAPGMTKGLNGKIMGWTGGGKATKWYLKAGNTMTKITEAIINPAQSSIMDGVIDETIAKITEDKFARPALDFAYKPASAPDSLIAANRLTESKALQEVIETAYWLVGFTPLGDIDTICQVLGQVGALVEKIVTQERCNNVMASRLWKESIPLRYAMMEDVAKMTPKNFVEFMTMLGFGDAIPDSFTNNLKFFGYHDSTFLLDHDRALLDARNFGDTITQGYGR